MRGHFVCEIDKFSRRFPAGGRAVVLLVEPLQNKLAKPKAKTDMLDELLYANDIANLAPKAPGSVHVKMNGD